MAKRQQQSTVRRDLVANRILEEAAAQFADQGFSATSLKEVADALGMSRTALYHYIGSKDALLTDLVQGLTKQTAEDMARISRDASLTSTQKIREAVRVQTQRIATNPARFRLLLVSEGSLTEPLFSQHIKARRQALRSLTEIVREGIDARELRPVEEHVAAFALLGMCNWVAWWYQPEREEAHPAEAIAEELAEMAVSALHLPEARRGAEADDPLRNAVSLLREDVAYLERSLDGDNR